ncbi:hypothetical protein HDV03_000322 [Kappamyces sp. JEL0829]|nr:hypothetical protein HDV03_000322 [Kappamyces sp. JEL0829]
MSDSNWICMLIDLIGESFLVRPKNADDLSMMLSDRVHYKEAREIREEDVEEFDLPTYTREFSHRNAEIVKLHFADEDHALLALALDEVMQALRRDRFAGSRNNLVTVTCLELLTKWQIAGLVEPNIAIFLSYSRHGHFPSIRRMAIESLILLSGLETVEMTRYLCHLCIDDPDPYIRYTTSIAMMNAVALACQQIRTIARPESRKQILRTQVLAMMDVWSPISPERFDFHVYRYLAKIVELAREIITDESRLVVKMPIKALVESTLSQIADESVVPDFQPALKPLKLSFKGLGATPASKKFAADDLRPKIMKKLLAQKAANWFLVPVDPVALQIPTYFEVIKRPMDLGTVKKKLDAGEYDGDEDFAADVRLVFSNAMQFNPPSSIVYVDAQNLAALFEREFGKRLQTPDQDASSTHSSVATPKLVIRKPAAPSLNELDLAQKILAKLLENKHSAIFKYPVDGEMYPDYYQIIDQPIDLQAIGKKISTKTYSSLQDFHNDMQLLISNCFTFNKKGTFGFAAGTEFQNVYQRLLKPNLKFITPESAKKIVPTAGPDVPKANVPAAALPASSPVAAPKQTGFKLRLPGLNAPGPVKLPSRQPPAATSASKPSFPTIVLKPPKPDNLSSDGDLASNGSRPSPSITFRIKQPTASQSPAPVSADSPASQSPSISGITLKFKTPSSAATASPGTPSGNPAASTVFKIPSGPLVQSTPMKTAMSADPMETPRTKPPSADSVFASTPASSSNLSMVTNPPSTPQIPPSEATPLRTPVLKLKLKLGGSVKKKE